jgi:hypothetical protein
VRPADLAARVGKRHGFLMSAAGLTTLPPIEGSAPKRRSCEHNSKNVVVEAAGIEPVFVHSRSGEGARLLQIPAVNPLPSPDFESSGFPCSPLESSAVLETFWRRYSEGARTAGRLGGVTSRWVGHSPASDASAIRLGQ